MNQRRAKNCYKFFRHLDILKTKGKTVTEWNTIYFYALVANCIIQSINQIYASNVLSETINNYWGKINKQIFIFKSVMDATEDRHLMIMMDAY